MNCSRHFNVDIMKLYFSALGHARKIKIYYNFLITKACNTDGFSCFSSLLASPKIKQKFAPICLSTSYDPRSHSACAVSFPRRCPAHTNSMEEWRRRAGVRSISIACLSNKKIIINFIYYLRHEILIDLSYQTKSSSGTLPYYQK